ncbi:MAG TPA: SPOCS domain-containing protein [Clostridiaceae bacterium]
MDIELIKENIECEQLLGENASDTVIKAEYIIPDTLPDVFEILLLDAKASIVSKEVIQDKVYLEGQIEYNVIYLSKDEESCGAHNVTYNGKFSNYVEINGALHKMFCEADCFIEHIEGGIINERKISIEGILNVKAEVYKNNNFQLIKDINNGDGIQLLKSPASIDRIVGNLSSDLAGKTQIMVPMDKPQIGSILSNNVVFHKKDVSVGEGEIQIGLFAKIGVLYKALDSNDLQYVSSDLFLSKREEMSGALPNMNCYHDFYLEDIDFDILSDDLGENRILDVDALVKATIKVVEKEEFQMIEDAYSPEFVIDMEKKKYDLNVIHGQGKAEVIVKGTIDIDSSNRPTEILLCKGRLNIIDKKVLEGKVIIEGIVSTDILYNTQDTEKPVNTASDEFTFTANLDIPDTKISMTSTAKAALELMEATIEGGSIAIKAVVSVTAQVNYVEGKEFLIDLAPSEDVAPQKKASITIYAVQNGDTLWKIAKKYYSTIDTLVNINELPGSDSIKSGDKLIIPGRAVM